MDKLYLINRYIFRRWVGIPSVFLSVMDLMSGCDESQVLV